MSDPIDEISTWAPVKLITGALAIIAGWLFKIVLARAKKTEDKIELLEKSREHAEKRVEILEKDIRAATDLSKDNRAEIAILMKRLEMLDKDLATRTMLGAMGDRLDGRITNIAQEQAVLKTVVSERTNKAAERRTSK